MNFSSVALSPGFLSGWYFNASFRYAFLISLVQTIVLTVVSVFRKYTIRTKFKKTEVNLMKSQDSDELTIDIDHLDLAQRQEKYPRATN